MTRHRTLLAVLGIFMMIGVLTPAHAAGWSDSAYYDQAQYGNGHRHGHGNSSGGLFHFSPTTSKIAKLGVTATGTVLAGIFGSQFGTIGTVVGGAAGFFVSKWIGEKLFGTNGYPGHYHDGQGFFSRLKDKILGRDRGPYPPVYGGGPLGGGPRWSQIAPGSAGNISDARKDFFNAMEEYKRAIATGTQAQKEAAKTAYDNARNAYFHFKSGN